MTNDLVTIVGVVITVLGAVASVVQLVEFVEKRRQQKNTRAQEPNPQLIKSASNPSTLPLPSLEELRSLLGADMDNPSTRALLKLLGKVEVIDGNAGGLGLQVLSKTSDNEAKWLLRYIIKHKLYAYESSGIMIASVDNVCSCISLYNESEDGFRKYRGKLPNELSWGDSRADVERKLGLPDDVHTSSGSEKDYPYLREVILDYRRREIKIAFRARGVRGQEFERMALVMLL